MLRASIPTRFQIPWAKNAAGAYIRVVPVASQIGIQDGAASFSDGFVPDNFTPLAAGGVPPFGQDFNGLENATTSWDQWYQAGGSIPYDATFATAVGGYPQGAELPSAILLGARWYSTVDGNLTDPDDPLNSAGWARVGIPAGTPLPFFSTTMPPGFVTMNALTIGNASSNAGYASADALFLFVANWTSFSNTQCPILTSAGAPSTRGANAVADFLANKRLTLPNGKGLGLMGVDTMGAASSTFLVGVPITIGNATTPGSIWGENLHTLTLAETVAHIHNNSLTDLGHVHGGVPSFPGGNPINTGGGGIAVDYNLNTASATSNITINNASAGGGGSHNTVERNMGVYWGQKL